MLKIQIIAGIISLSFLVIIFEAIRRRKFMEKYALLWIFSGLIIFIFSLFPNLLFKIGSILGLHHLTVLLTISFIFLLSIVFYLSISISGLSEKNKELTQEIGILKLKLNKLENKSKGGQEKTN